MSKNKTIAEAAYSFRFGWRDCFENITAVLHISQVRTSDGVSYWWNEIHNNSRVKATGVSMVFMQSFIKICTLV